MPVILATQEAEFEASLNRKFVRLGMVSAPVIPALSEAQ
jgi:hypothetical protein